MKKGLTRRDALKLSGLALGGLAFGGTMAGAGAGKARADCATLPPCYPTSTPTQQYSYFFGSPDSLDTIIPWKLDNKGEITGTPLEQDEMRITFLGSMVPPVRRAQQEMSVFVEVGWDKDRPVDQFVFDCGSGVCANYGAMGIGYSRMDKIFLAHLHGDHMSDLSHIYCFGPSADRKSPLYVWGPGPSGVRSPRSPYRLYDDGTKAFCKNLREAMRWHSESFSFETSSYEDYQSIAPTKESWGLPVDLVHVGDDPRYDGYALYPIQLDWTKYGKKTDRNGIPDNIAYWNKDTHVKITHFPVIHTRKGAIGYKLEWNGLSMIYTSDTRPETHCIDQAKNGGKGVDVFIHEMALPPEVWAMKNLGLNQPGSGQAWDAYVQDLTNVIGCSHTPQGAFGYLLSQIQPRPRLTVATHFPVADDTVACALNSVKAHVPDITWNKVYDPIHKNITWSFDLMVIRIFADKDEILQQRAVVNDYGFSPPTRQYPNPNDPKYPDPRQQIDPSTEIPANQDGTVNYCSNGY